MAAGAARHKPVLSDAAGGAEGAGVTDGEMDRAGNSRSDKPEKATPKTPNARAVSSPGACVTMPRQPPLSGLARTLVLANKRGREPPRTTAVACVST
jgi:hypothetical protein